MNSNSRTKGKQKKKNKESVQKPAPSGPIKRPVQGPSTEIKEEPGTSKCTKNDESVQNPSTSGQIKKEPGTSKCASDDLYQTYFPQTQRNVQQYDELLDVMTKCIQGPIDDSYRMNSDSRTKGKQKKKNKESVQKPTSSEPIETLVPRPIITIKYEPRRSKRSKVDKEYSQKPSTSRQIERPVQRTSKKKEPGTSKRSRDELYQTYSSQRVGQKYDDDVDVMTKLIEGPIDDSRRKLIKVSNKKFGFIGLGNLGRALIKTMVKAGHKITVWNRSPDKYLEFQGIKKAKSPADLVLKCDIIFCCVKACEASKDVLLGPRGVLIGFHEAQKLNQIGKCYIEMSFVEPDVSCEIRDLINSKQGFYLEAPFAGSSHHVLNRSTILLASGDRRAYLECDSCFCAIGRYHFHLSNEIGDSSMLLTIISAVKGILVAALAEIFALAKQLNVDLNYLRKILILGPLNPERIEYLFQMMQCHRFPAVRNNFQPQKYINECLIMSDMVSQPMPITAAANEIYKLSKCLGFQEGDLGAVYKTLHHRLQSMNFEDHYKKEEY